MTVGGRVSRFGDFLNSTRGFSGARDKVKEGWGTEFEMYI